MIIDCLGYVTLVKFIYVCRLYVSSLCSHLVSSVFRYGRVLVRQIGFDLAGHGFMWYRVFFGIVAISDCLLRCRLIAIDCLLRRVSGWVWYHHQYQVSTTSFMMRSILQSSPCNIQGQGSEMPSSFCSSTVSLSAWHIP